MQNGQRILKYNYNSAKTSLFLPQIIDFQGIESTGICRHVLNNRRPEWNFGSPVGKNSHFMWGITVRECIILHKCMHSVDCEFFSVYVYDIQPPYPAMF